MRVYPFIVLSFLLFLSFGCVTSQTVDNSRNPEVTIDESGIIAFNGKQLKTNKIARALSSAGIEKTRVVTILIPENRDRTLMKAVTAELVRNGYHRVAFVTKRKTMATVIAPK